MRKPLKVSFCYTNEELDKISAVDFSRRNIIRFFELEGLILALLVLFGLLGLNMSWFSLYHFLVSIVLTVLMLGLLWLLLRNRRPGATSIVWELSLTEDGLELTSANSYSQRSKWKQIRKIEADNTSVVLHAKGHTFFYIPKRELKEETYDFLRSHLPGNVEGYVRLYT